MATVRFALHGHSPAIRSFLPGSYKPSELSRSEALALRNLLKIPKIMDVNLKAPLFIAQTVAKSMVENQTRGSIVHLSSQASKFASPIHTVYSCSKAGLDMLCKNMALELGPHGIRVNCVNPTVVWTAMTRDRWTGQKLEGLLSKTPLGKVAEIEDCVNAVLFLLSDKSAMTTGTTFMVEGGRLCT